jgi:outer membrane protein assembly factor BamB/serine/threonine protein kinase
MKVEREPNAATFASPPRRELNPTVVESGEQIGRGGNAVVSVVELGDTEPPERVAVREPLSPGTLEKDTIDTFLSEASTWERVDEIERTRRRWQGSEHVVGVVDTGDQLPWVALEYMDGGSLATYLDETSGPLPVDEALWIGESVCRGVAVAHSVGIVHLDLKPSNILLRATPEDVWDVPKVADWGLARVLADQTGTIEGLSPEYAAPEQFDREQFGEPDTLTDIYQAGAIVYELLTGKPLASGTRFQAMQAVLSAETPPKPSSQRSGLGPKIDAVVEVALARSKTDRYSAMPVMVNTLHALRTDGALPPVVAERVDGTQSSVASVTQDGPSDESDIGGDTKTKSKETGDESVDGSDAGSTTDEEIGLGSTTELADNVAAYENPGSFTASGGDHMGTIPKRDKTETADEQAATDTSGTDTTNAPESSKLSIADRVSDYEKPSQFRASPGDHTDVESSSDTGNAVSTTSTDKKEAEPEWPTFSGNDRRTGWASTVDTGPKRKVAIDWTYSMDSIKAAPAVRDGIVYVGSNGKTFTALDVSTGSVEWDKRIGEQRKSAPAVTEDAVFVGSTDGSIYGFDRVTGSKQWRFETEQAREISGTPIVVDGTVYVGGKDKNLYAINAANGTERWQTWCTAPKSAPAVAEGMVYVGGRNEKIFALERETGEKRWTFDTDRPIWSSPAVVEDTVYVGCWDNSLYALNRHSGDLVWEFGTDRSIPGAPAVDGETLYVGNNGNNVYALDLATGDVLWEQSVSWSVRVAVTVAGGTVYVGANDGTIHALNAETGAVEWTCEVDGRIDASPAVTADRLFVGTSQGLYSLTVEPNGE